MKTIKSRLKEYSFTFFHNSMTTSIIDNLYIIQEQFRAIIRTQQKGIIITVFYFQKAIPLDSKRGFVRFFGLRRPVEIYRCVFYCFHYKRLFGVSLINLFLEVGTYL